VEHRFKCSKGYENFTSKTSRKGKEALRQGETLAATGGQTGGTDEGEEVDTEVGREAGEDSDKRTRCMVMKAMTSLINVMMNIVLVAKKMFWNSQQVFLFTACHA
jgi:hypothetical protein